MPHSTKRGAARKPHPGKPHPDFPLWPHQNGRWAKKVRGRFYYFGSVADDPKGKAALELWLAQKDDLLAGRKPREASEGVTIDELVNRFLAVKDALVQSGELSKRTWSDYRATADTINRQFGAGRVVVDLRADDFDGLRETLARGRGPAALGREIQHVRTIFKFAYDSDLIDRPIKFGPTFKKPSRKVMRKARQDAGPKLFTADEIRAMLAAAGPSLKAMILLGVNCGMGNHDVASLPLDRIDLDAGWHTFGRPKTGVVRRCPLWPETVAALREALEHRPEPHEAEAEGLVFVTKYGRRFVRLKDTTWVDGVAQECAKLLRRLKIKRPGVAFYTLRRTFRTVADETKDQPAVTFVMGHADDADDMGAVYRQHVADDRLQAVVEHVRGWLFAAEGDEQ